jgi:hypothetical protein
LEEALNGIMDGVKGVSLVEEAPAIDPNLLFLPQGKAQGRSKDEKEGGKEE